LAILGIGIEPVLARVVETAQAVLLRERLQVALTALLQVARCV
jgi:hypothetical protein